MIILPYNLSINTNQSQLSFNKGKTITPLVDCSPPSSWHYLDWDLGLKLPQLVLATRVGSGKFVTDHKFYALEHQSAGCGCHHLQVLGTILTPTKTGQELMKFINDKWLDSQTGFLGNNLDQVVEYQNDLKKFGLDCKFSYESFEEAVYPIDIEDNTLSEICKDKFPDYLDDLLGFDTDMSMLLGSLDRWRLYILGENSD